MFLTDLQVVACPGSALLEHSPFLPFFVFSLIMLITYLYRMASLSVIREAIRYKKCSFLTLFKRGGGELKQCKFFLQISYYSEGLFSNIKLT